MTGLQHLFAGLRSASPDADLVRAFVADRDEAAFAQLVRRHGPLVYGVCRRVFPPAADDAFQATFLLLARKAGRLRDPAGVAGWLHGVAVRTALEAKAMAARRRFRERRAAKPEAAPEPADGEALARLDAAVQGLPARYRAAVLLCDLAEKTRAEAAAELGVPEGTVASRLARGRKLLAAKLGGVPVVVAVTVPPVLATRTVQLAAGGAVPPGLPLLVTGVSRAMSGSGWKLAVAAGVVAVGVGGAWGWQAGDKPPAKPADAPPAAVQPAEPEAAPGVRPLAAWAGEYTYRKTEYRDGNPGEQTGGRLRIRVVAQGHAVCLEKRDDAGYDDLIVVQFDQPEGKAVGTLYSPQPMPRPFAATLGDGLAVFAYGKATLADGTVFATRETLKRTADGLRWLVEWQMADGSLVKRREIVATKK